MKWVKALPDEETWTLVYINVAFDRLCKDIRHKDTLVPQARGMRELSFGKSFEKAAVLSMRMCFFLHQTKKKFINQTLCAQSRGWKLIELPVAIYANRRALSFEEKK